jgi:peptidoglycan/LPS O-acetylase OafA/YrhL
MGRFLAIGDGALSGLTNFVRGSTHSVHGPDVPSYRRDIDGLRALAVLSVLVFHSFPEDLPGGFIGVDVFFVISGFLISSLIFASIRNGSFSFASFYYRRIRRLLPALLAVLCAVFAAGWFTQVPHDLEDLNKLILSSVLFVPNFTLWAQAGYFAGDPMLRPLLHLWSLGVEEQFYLFWPVSVLVLWKQGLTWLILVLAGASFAAGVLLISRHPSAVFYLPATRLWELLAGAFLAWCERGHVSLDAATKLPMWARQTFSLAGMALLLASIFFLNSNMQFPGWWALPPVIGTTLVIAGGSDSWINRVALGNRTAVFIGLISYPLYLWHWPILVFIRITTEQIPTGLEKVSGVVLALLLAWLTYRFIEQPIRRHAPGVERPAAIMELLGTAGAVAVASALAIGTHGVPSRYPDTLRAFLTYTYDGRHAWKSECYVSSPDEWKQDLCVDADGATAGPLVALWGDSHAAHLRPGLDALKQTVNFRIAQMTGSGCPPFVNVDKPGLPYCRSLNDGFLNHIRALRPDMVILAAFWWSQGYEPLAQTIRLLQEAKIKRIVVVGPVPRWGGNLPDLLIRSALANGYHVPTSFGPEMRSDMPEAPFRSLVEGAGASYIVSMDALCPANQCVTMTAYGPQYVISFDYSHLTDAGSELLIQRISDQLFAGLNVAPR